MSHAKLVNLCQQRGVVAGCWNNAGVWTPVLIHPSYGADGLPIPEGTVSAQDGTTLTGLVVTDLANNILPADIADVSAGSCSESLELCKREVCLCLDDGTVAEAWQLSTVNLVDLTMVSGPVFHDADGNVITGTGRGLHLRRNVR